MKTILVLGASGFLGANASKWYSVNPNYNLQCSYHNRVLPFPVKRVFYADLTHPVDINAILEGVKPDIVLQLAASTTNMKDVIERPYVHVTDNAVMNARLFEAFHNHNVKHVIFTSCTTMYPGDLKRPALEADFDRNRIHPKYFGVASTKVYIEDLCRFWSTLGRTKYTVFRHSNIIGPYDRYDLKTGHVFSATVKKIIDATDSIDVWGSGTEVRDFLYVDDLMMAFDAAIAKQATPFEIFNIGSGIPCTVTEMIRILIACSGKNIKVSYDTSKPSIDFSLILDTAKAKEQLGWSIENESTYYQRNFSDTYRWALANLSL